LFAYCPADAAAVRKPHHLLSHLNPDWSYLQCFQCLVPAHPGSPGKRAVKRVCVVLPFWYRLTQVVLEKRLLNGCSVVVPVLTEYCERALYGA